MEKPFTMNYGADNCPHNCIGDKCTYCTKVFSYNNITILNDFILIEQVETLKERLRKINRMESIAAIMSLRPPKEYKSLKYNKKRNGYFKHRLSH